MAKVLALPLPGRSPAFPRRLRGAKVLALPPREWGWLRQEAIVATGKATSAPMHPRKATKSKKKLTQATADATTRRPPAGR
jgi:hypothetical protein